MLDLSMSFGVEFDKEITEDEIDCRPGGYQIVTNSGDIYSFDFEDVEQEVDRKNRKVVHFKCSFLDYDSYPDMTIATWDDIEDIQDFVEFYSDSGWSSDYIPTRVKYLVFESGFDEFRPAKDIVDRIENVIS